MVERFAAQLKRSDSVTVIVATGDLGIFGRDRLQDLIRDALTEPVTPDVVMDLSGVTHLDLDGVALIEYARRVAHQSGVVFTLVSNTAIDTMMQELRSPDRRINRTTTSADIFVNCRLCWHRVQLEANRVEISDSQVVYRCQQCDNTFLIRAADAASLDAS
jgi:anti-anti-sigma factor